MKPAHLILTASLALNLVLSVLFVWLRSGSLSPVEAERAAGARREPGVTGTKDQRLLPANDVGLSPVDASGIRALKLRLEKEGYAPSIVRGAVVAAVNDLFMSRQRSVLPKRNIPKEFWRNPPPTVGASLETREQMRAIDRERNALLLELVGSDFRVRDQDEESVAYRHRRYGDISVETISKIERINSDYTDLASRVRDDTLGVMKAADFERLALLEREKRADLERLLTPEGLLEYDLRNSSSAAYVRNRLGQFAATEQEFRALYEARRAFDDMYATADSRFSPEIAQKRSSAERELDERFRAILGESRYAEYQRANRPTLTVDASEFGASSGTMQRLAERLSLPATASQSALQLQGDFHKRIDAVFSDSKISNVERQTQLLRLGLEAMEKFSAVLGPNGYNAYRENGGQWINELQRPLN